jgi:hypothetical protein
MRPGFLAAVAALLLAAVPGSAIRSDAATPASGSPALNVTAVNESTWVDHDGRPMPKPPDHEDDFWAHDFHQAVVDPLTHLFDVPDKLLFVARLAGVATRREAVNVNTQDEVPNSTWFTNRNHLHAVPTAELRNGPDSLRLPARPWVITHLKQGGMGRGFRIRDADGYKWLVKLEPQGYPQLCTGADMVARTLLHAAGYNVPHNEPVRFVRDDLVIDPKLSAASGEDRFTSADLDSLLAGTARFPDGRYSAFASLFVPGHVVGAPNLNHRRRGDGNDWYTPANRRELRGLFVIASWINFWDTKDSNFLDTFVATQDSLGHLVHYVLDPGSALGANALGPRIPTEGFENTIDFGWIGRRFITLGWVEEPWRRVRPDSLPSVGSFESAEFDPGAFATEVPHPAFRAMTDRDAYWGAKIVGSFSDAQIAAAVDAAQYDAPAARDLIEHLLIERRDKVTRYWFARVAPLDFFTIQSNTLRFHDLAVDLQLTPARDYDVLIQIDRSHRTTSRRVHLTSAELPLAEYAGDGTLSLDFAIPGTRSKHTRVELKRTGSAWMVSRVRHA